MFCSVCGKRALCASVRIESGEEVGVVVPHAKRVATDRDSPGEASPPKKLFFALRRASRRAEDSDEEEDDSEELSDESNDRMYDAAGAGASDEDEWDDEEEGEEEEGEAGDEFFPSTLLSESAIALALPQQLGLDPAKVQIMNSVLFDTEYTDQDGIRRVARLDELRPRSQLMLRSLASPQQPHKQTQQQQRLEDASMMALTPARKKQQVVDTSRVVCPPEMRLSNQPDCQQQSLLMRMSRNRFSFGVGFGPQGQVVHAGGSVSDAEVLVSKLRGEPTSRAAVEALMLHKTHFWDTRDAGTTVAVLADSFVKQSAQAEALGPYERSCWGLADALWGNVQENNDGNAHKESVVRRRLVSDWLEGAVHEAVEADLARAGQSVPARVLALLSGHRVAEAVQECVANNYLRLAAIVAASATTHESKMCLSQQQWSKEFVDKDELLVMQLLYGGTDDFFLSTRFDWVRNFGIFLWYRFAWDRPVASVFRGFANFVRKTSPGQPVVDFRFNLLRLFADPATPPQEVLAPESYGSSPINWRLAYTMRYALSHLPQRAASSAGVRVIVPLASDAATGAKVASRFAEHLEQMGLWQWAVFVLVAEPSLSLPHKTAAVRAVLQRSSGSTLLRSEDGDAFVRDLQVDWVSSELREAQLLFANRLTAPPTASRQTEGSRDLYDAIDSYLGRH